MLALSDDRQAPPIGPDLDPQFRRPAEGSLNRFNNVPRPDFLGPFQQTATEKEQPKRLHGVVNDLAR
jgi:hypothetical protein